MGAFAGCGCCPDCGPESQDRDLCPSYDSDDSKWDSIMELARVCQRQRRKRAGFIPSLLCQRPIPFSGTQLALIFQKDGKVALETRSHQWV